jgi:DNA polymerase-3 subunit delta'
MIELLKTSYKLNKLHNSWLINTNDPDQTLTELQKFIDQTLFDNKISLQNNPDFKLVEKKPNPQNKDISVEQIRELQEFFNRTSIMFPHKIAIIARAELMNHHAANCTLKILEEAPGNSYIFLITTTAASILPTIRSRCAKIHHLSTIQNETDEAYYQLINILANNNSVQKLELLKKVSDKNREHWVVIADYILQFMVRITKKSAGVQLELSNAEIEVINRLRMSTPTYLLQKFETIHKLINNTINYDLDLRASCVLLLEQFSE